LLGGTVHPEGFLLNLRPGYLLKGMRTKFADFWYYSCLTEKIIILQYFSQNIICSEFWRRQDLEIYV